MRIILLGPTAAGKTELSLQLAEKLNTSIISADSRQCFKHINIGTAKPSPEELDRTQHYNISLLGLDEEDSAMDFQKRAEQWEKEILQKSEHVIYAGGSTLHLQSLIQPFNEMPESNEENIEELESRIEREGLESLYGMLKEVDPEYAKKMDGMNRQRIIRALDVWMKTGKPFSSFHSNDEIYPDEDTLVFGLKWPRQKLYDRINQRVDQMIEQGLVDEVKSILASGHSKELQSLNTVGYKEIIKYLEGEWTLEKAVEKIKTSTRRYAKRQITWFKRWEFIEWLDAEELSVDEMKERIVLKVAQG
ncbi:tRNA (adenosine(37)-N6)-dimethylallyltransferase MiaA [Gracilimonas sediminicola]|uniref:tRNA dimethylallyltransferase n=1 Tax=Gracilimonas sediminicola TaxID=2952158 RepID=A0A9X2L3W8_9BACT|nr:tRNA (adenosine(37)-N6)-dimethylallyltransferase MiaA [Gracilimonas sediminicola]MCP9291348.1 tRNA (adenosine(37)-N6)-dimethylallyltransferase MiaA [Gracilimonas sediminicola]